MALAFVLVTAAGVQDAYAQNTRRIHFTTAFPFTVGNAMLPGGTYSIAPSDLEPAVLVIRGFNTSVFERAIASGPAEPHRKSEVVFERFGNGYILKSVWVARSSVGYQMDVKAAERRLARANEIPTEVRVSARPAPTQAKSPTVR